MENKKAVPEYKKKLVAELSKLLKSHKTLLIASVRGLPGSQFQEIKKNIRDSAIVKVPKKNLMFRAIEECKIEGINSIEEKMDDSFAVLFSDEEAFQLAGKLLKNKTAAKAKPGQIAPTNIEIPAGPTELTPGPAISELGAIGIKIQIKEGKIHITDAKIVAKEGEAISQKAADIMSKLGIKPFSIGYIPVAAFDLENKIYYASIDIDSEGYTNALKEFYGRALPFAVEIGYASKETIAFMIGKAGMYGKALEKLSGSEKPAEDETNTSEETKTEEANSDEQASPEEEK